MTKALDNFFWHDGNLIDVSFTINKKGASAVQITALFYKDGQAKGRETYQIKCDGVSRFNCTLDSEELKIICSQAIFPTAISKKMPFGSTLQTAF